MDKHQVILSLGTNQGNRLENIVGCIAHLHAVIGTIIKVSKLYETPAWGFEGDDFYNCAVLMVTDKPAHQVLEEVLLLEKTLGRVRSEGSGYQSRMIDIDMITFDEEVIDSETLQIPHPEMQNRLFVMLPMSDLFPDWEHPVLRKKLRELLELVEDKSSCVVVGDLQLPC